MVMLNMCIIKDIAVVFLVYQAIFQWKKWCSKFVNKTNDIKGTALFRFLSKFASDVEAAIWLYNNSDIAVIKIIIFRKIKIRPVCILFTNISKVCFLYSICTTFELNKSNHSGDKTKRFPFLNIQNMLFGLFLCVPIKKLVYLLWIFLTLKGDRFCWCK